MLQHFAYSLLYVSNDFSKGEGEYIPAPSPPVGKILRIISNKAKD